VLDSAVTFAERLRQRVEQHTFSFEGGTLKRTVSLGVASWPHPRIKGREAMLKAADDALYVAKEMGRNRVIRFDSAEFNEHTKPDEDADAEENRSSSNGSADARVAAEGRT
jgi:predicted signal transduction protein with EAL and GGDEF domain